MEVYMERTHGVYIQEEESAVAWQFRDADPEFAHIQSKELEDQLTQLLKSLNVDVVRGEDYIEVRPQGISKGDFIRSLMDDMFDEGIDHSSSSPTNHQPPDFVLCIGDDASDEKSYQVVKRVMRMATLSSAFQHLGPDSNSLSLNAGSSYNRHQRSETFTNSKGKGPEPIKIPTDNRVYFTSTVGKKPTFADSYLNSSDDVIEILESFSKTADLIQHSLSTGNLVTSSLFNLYSPLDASTSTNSSSPDRQVYQGVTSPTGPPPQSVINTNFKAGIQALQGNVGEEINNNEMMMTQQTISKGIGPGAGSSVLTGGLHPISESPTNAHGSYLLQQNMNNKHNQMGNEATSPGFSMMNEIEKQASSQTSDNYENNSNLRSNVRSFSHEDSQQGQSQSNGGGGGGGSGGAPSIAMTDQDESRSNVTGEEKKKKSKKKHEISDHMKLVSRRLFKDFSLPHQDGCYYLRSDRVLGAFHMSNKQVVVPTTTFQSPLPVLGGGNSSGSGSPQIDRQHNSFASGAAENSKVFLPPITN
mmetsp:Transcript_18560/g.22008  ORF Transcript_18560/g.22008 Transcript_18560/m.22008 type:complete len:529 (-) Transcript_18560:302-1888(-)